MNFQAELNRIETHAPQGQVIKQKPRRQRRQELRDRVQTIKASKK